MEITIAQEEMGTIKKSRIKAGTPNISKNLHKSLHFRERGVSQEII